MPGQRGGEEEGGGGEGDRDGGGRGRGGGRALRADCHPGPTVTQDRVKGVHTVSCQSTQSLVGPFPWDPRRQFMAEQGKWQIIV